MKLTKGEKNGLTIIMLSLIIVIVLYLSGNARIDVLTGWSIGLSTAAFAFSSANK